MARPIGLERASLDPREELRRRLEQAPEQHAEALLDLYELLQQLRDAGVLKLLGGALGSGGLLLETAVNAARSEEAIRGLRNAIILAKMLGSINPDLLQSYANAVSETFGCEKPAVESPGLFQLFAGFRNPELRRSMAFINKFLESFGSQLKSRTEIATD